MAWSRDTLSEELSEKECGQWPQALQGVEERQGVGDEAIRAWIFHPDDAGLRLEGFARRLTAQGEDGLRMEANRRSNTKTAPRLAFTARPAKTSSFAFR